MHNLRNYNQSKKERTEIYNFVQELLNRELTENETTTFSKLIRNVIHVQSKNVSIERDVLLKKFKKIKKDNQFLQREIKRNNI